MGVRDTYSKMFQRYRDRPAWYVSSPGMGKINKLAKSSQPTPSIVVTDHAQDRLHEKMNVQKPHMHRVALKGWNSEEKIPEAWPLRKINYYSGLSVYGRLGDNYIYKRYKSFIFVFVRHHFKKNTLILVTIRGPYEEEKNNN